MAQYYVYDWDTNQPLSFQINTDDCIFKQFTGDGPARPVQDFQYVKIKSQHWTRYYQNPFLSESEMLSSKQVPSGNIGDCAFVQLRSKCYQWNSYDYLRYAQDFDLVTNTPSSQPVIWASWGGLSEQRLIQLRYYIESKNIAAYGPRNLNKLQTPLTPNQDFYFRTNNQISNYPYFGFLKSYTVVGSYMNLKDIPEAYHDYNYVLLQCGSNQFQYVFSIGSYDHNMYVNLTTRDTNLYPFTYDSNNEKWIAQRAADFILPTVSWNLSVSNSDWVYLTGLPSGTLDITTNFTINLPKIDGISDPTWKNRIRLGTQENGFLYMTARQYSLYDNPYPIQGTKGYIRFPIDCNGSNYAHYANGLTGSIYDNMGTELSDEIEAEDLFQTLSNIVFIPYQIQDTMGGTSILKMKLWNNPGSTPSGTSLSYLGNPESISSWHMATQHFDSSGQDQGTSYFLNSTQASVTYRYFPCFMEPYIYSEEFEEDVPIGFSNSFYKWLRTTTSNPSTDYYQDFNNNGNAICSWYRKNYQGTYGTYYDYIFWSLSTDWDSNPVPQIGSTTYDKEEDCPGFFYVLKYEHISE